MASESARSPLRNRARSSKALNQGADKPVEQSSLQSAVAARPKVFRYIPVLHEFVMTTIVVEIPLAFYLLRNDNLPLLLTLAVGVALFVEVAKFIARSIANPLGSFVLRAGLVDADKKGRHPLASKTNLEKWESQVWQLAVHVLFTALEWYAIYELPHVIGEAWPQIMPETMNLWTPHPSLQTTPDFVKYIYYAQLSVWVYTGVLCAFFEPRRKDFYEMMLHHVVTVGLVLGSAAWGYYRAGLAILFLNDACDISVDVMKMANYLKLRNAKGLMIAEVLFLNMIGAFMYWRLYLAPTVMLRSTLWEAHYTISQEECGELAGQPFACSLKDVDWTNPMTFMNFKWFYANGDLFWEMNILLWVLLAIHFFWLLMMFRILLRLVTTSAEEASREEYEGESEDEEDEDVAPHED